MPSSIFSPAGALDREFLDIRCRLIDLAAMLDRVARAETDLGDPRLAQIRQGLEILLSEVPNRAEQVLRTFSLPMSPVKGLPAIAGKP